MVQGIGNFTSFDGKKYSSDEYEIKKSTNWNDNDTTSVYEKESGKLIYSQCSGSVSEFSDTYVYDENGNLKACQNDWYECGYDYATNPDKWFRDSNELYRTTKYYDEDGKVTLSTYDEKGDGILESVSHYTYNENGSYEVWQDANMNDKFDDADHMTYYNADNSYLSQEKYDELNDIKQPETEVDEQPGNKENIFGKIKNFFIGLFS